MDKNKIFPVSEEFTARPNGVASSWNDFLATGDWIEREDCSCLVCKHDPGILLYVYFGQWRVLRVD